MLLCENQMQQKEKPCQEYKYFLKRPQEVFDVDLKWIVKTINDSFLGYADYIIIYLEMAKMALLWNKT